MLAGAEGVALGHQMQAAADTEVEELLHHLGYQLVAYDGHFGVVHHQFAQGSGVVHLHVLDDDIVQLTATEHVIQILQILLGSGSVHSVEHHGFLIQQDIGVVRHAHGDLVDALEQSQAPVVGADPGQIISNFSDTIHFRATSFPITKLSAALLLFFAQDERLLAQMDTFLHLHHIT